MTVPLNRKQPAFARKHGILLVGLCLLAAVGAPALLRPQSQSSTLLRKDPVLTRHAEGPFDVKTTPLAADDATGSPAISRYALLKQFHGDLEAVSKGEMLGSGNPAKGSAGYVAIEQVTGTLLGHSGSFALQHIGIMDQGKLQLSVTVVPGSGTGELAGIAGTMTITNVGGKHSYSFEYTLPASAP
jgi:hypothetical protein